MSTSNPEAVSGSVDNRSFSSDISRTEPELQVTLSGERQGLPISLWYRQSRWEGDRSSGTNNQSEDEVTKSRKESFI